MMVPVLSFAFAIAIQFLFASDRQAAVLAEMDFFVFFDLNLLAVAE